jgi:hypothetical protein
VQPAIYEFEGKTIRPLGRETDKAFALVNSLDEAQRKQAILGFEMRDLVLGPGRDGQTIQPEGVKGSALTEKSSRRCFWTWPANGPGIMNDCFGKAKLDEVRRTSPTHGSHGAARRKMAAPLTFESRDRRSSSSTLRKRLGGDATKHIHTIYRDPTNEYGAKWWKP